MDPDINDEQSLEELFAVAREQQEEIFLEKFEISLGDVYDGTQALFADVNLVVCSAVEAIDFASDEPWACISIHTREGGWPELSEENRVALLQLAFGDVEYPVDSRAGRSFSRSDARKVIDFVLEHSSKISTLLIHCERGESRSAGIAAAIAPLFGRTAHDIEHTGHRPNRLVFNLVRDYMPPSKWEQEDYEELLDHHDVYDDVYGDGYVEGYSPEDGD